MPLVDGAATGSAEADGQAPTAARTVAGADGGVGGTTVADAGGGAVGSGAEADSCADAAAAGGSAPGEPREEAREAQGGGGDDDEDSDRSPLPFSEGSDDPFEEERRRAAGPEEDGCFYDDPLWYGKTQAQIETATELEKANGNAASRDGMRTGSDADWKRANRYWKNALRGAQKLLDAELEIRLRVNLALGYVKRKKPDKALEHCRQVFTAKLVGSATDELRVKAHYRSAEAHEVAGDLSKAMASLRAALEIEPGNAGSRAKLAALKQVERQRLDRERALFAGKLPRPAMDPDSRTAAAKAEDAPESETEDRSEDSEAAPPEELDDETRHAHEQSMRMVDSLTDRAAASRLASGISGEHNWNVRVGQPVQFYREAGDSAVEEGS